MKMARKIKVFVAMSGGVDSSVAAALLKKRGFNVIGAHIKCFNVDGCGEKDTEDAKRIAEQLKIPFYVFNLEKEYKKKVVSYMINEYKDGLTPNPDIVCNKEIKFGLFLDKALRLGASHVATGHYVKIKKLKNIYHLYQAKDLNKDQSYFLWTLTQNQLKHCLFPIGNYTKPQIRKLAKKFGLLTAEKKDSQGICFLGKIALKDFLKNYIAPRSGVILDTKGKILGYHNGSYFYTIGQRHGLNLGGYKNPLYVVEKNTIKNTITVAQENKNKAFCKVKINLRDMNIVNKDFKIGENGLKVLTRIRYRQPLAQATLFKTGLIIFNTPQKFVASGQSAVFYKKNGELVGGGILK